MITSYYLGSCFWIPLCLYFYHPPRHKSRTVHYVYFPILLVTLKQDLEKFWDVWIRFHILCTIGLNLECLPEIWQQKGGIIAKSTSSPSIHDEITWYDSHLGSLSRFRNYNCSRFCMSLRECRMFCCGLDFAMCTGLCKKVVARLQEKSSPITTSPGRPCQAGA